MGIVSSERQQCCSSIVANARMSAGLDKHIILRCASTDPLADAATTSISTNSNTNSQLLLGAMDQAILKRAGLMLDLRSSSERQESKAKMWMSSRDLVGQDLFVATELNAQEVQAEADLVTLLDNHARLVIRLDILSPNFYMTYLEQNWLSPSQQKQANQYRQLGDRMGLHKLRIQTLNQQGLLGLNQAILETGQAGICAALQLITLHLERLVKHQHQEKNDKSNNNNGYYDLVVIHCVQGKDRTGVLVMLCQSLLGVPQEVILDDYHQSDLRHPKHNRRRSQRPENNEEEETSAAMERVTEGSKSQSTNAKTKPQQHGHSRKGDEAKLDRSLFFSAPRRVMKETLEFLTTKYNSVCPGYVASIGFDHSWQQRFQHAYLDLETTQYAATSGVFPSKSKL